MNMHLDRKLKKWNELGIIDNCAKDKILALENDTKTSYILNAIMALGGVSIIVGIISLIAANWYKIPGYIKLTCNYLWLLALAVSILYAHTKRLNLIRELLIFLFWGSILGSIALIGQVYHLQSHIFNATFFWLATTTPIILLSKERILPHLWTIALIVLFALFLSYLYDEKIFNDPYLFINLLPLLLFYLSEAFAFYRYNLHFKPVIKNIAWVVLCVTVAIWGATRWVYVNHPDHLWIPICIIAFSIPALVLYYKQNNPLTGSLIVLGVMYSEIPTFIANKSYVLLPQHELKILGGILYIALAAFVAFIGIKVKYKRIFDGACLIIALRIIIIYFEVFGTLLKTGAGLILSGIIVLGLAFVWHKKRNLIWKLSGDQQ